MSLGGMDTASLKRAVLGASVLALSACGAASPDIASESTLASASTTPAATYYTSQQVTDACDRLIEANRSREAAVPRIELCVGRGADSTSISGLSVAIRPDEYAKLSEAERSTTETAFGVDARMPVSLRAGEAPQPA